MKKILLVSTVSRQFYLFEQGNIEVLKSLGYEIHTAANFSDANERLDALDIVRHHFDIQRSPFSIRNITAYKQLKKIMRDGNYDAVHCHSPMGGVLARLAARAVGIKHVIYTAHGFHFYKGAPLINWLVYYTIEKFLARFTDVLITINNEDYTVAKSFKAKRAVYVPGVGVNTGAFARNLDIRNAYRVQLGISDNTVLLLSVGEMIKRKNHEAALKAIAELNHDHLIYLIVGRGVLRPELEKLAESLGIKDKVRFLGFRNDIANICSAADIYLFPSFQEGLPVSLMEAMAAGLPCVASRIRGNIDLLEDGKGGFLCAPDDIDGMSRAINALLESEELRKSFGGHNAERIKAFDMEIVKQEMHRIYSNELLEDAGVEQ